MRRLSCFGLCSCRFVKRVRATLMTALLLLAFFVAHGESVILALIPLPCLLSRQLCKSQRIISYHLAMIMRLGSSKAPATASDIRYRHALLHERNIRTMLFLFQFPPSAHSLGRELSIIFLWLFGCVVACLALALLRSAPESSQGLTEYSDTHLPNFDTAHHRTYLRLVVLLYLPVFPLMLGTLIFAGPVSCHSRIQ